VSSGKSDGAPAKPDKKSDSTAVAKISDKVYEAELSWPQVELVNLQAWVRYPGARPVVI
jgi:polyphosphate kinase 2 (PPK2 family)